MIFRRRFFSEAEPAQARRGCGRGAVRGGRREQRGGARWREVALLPMLPFPFVCHLPVVFARVVAATAFAALSATAQRAMDDEEEYDALPVVPLGDKKLRACLVTGLVKTEDQFYREGNDNVPCLKMANDRDTVMECTSSNFDGMIAIMKPNESWAARWQGISGFVPGCYAQRVRGTLAPQHITTLEDNGIRYRPLDEAEAQQPR